MEHFNQYVYGQKFLVESDHKPLQTILKRNINNAPPRIQCMLLCLQKYDLELYFTPGSTIPVADTLSRAFLPGSAPLAESVFDYQVHMLLEILVRNKPLARFQNLFSVITVILLINMPIPFKFDSCKNFATNLNAANSLGLGSKKCSKHFTLNNTYRFLIIFSL